MQHQALQTALQDYGYNVITVPIILGVSGAQCHTTTDALKQLGIERSQASTLMLKLHEHAVTSLHKLVISRRVLERVQRTDQLGPGRSPYIPLSMCQTYFQIV